ncbi:Bax1-I domain containing protein [Trichuris trichiura]|uniref:Bax1-I domain containing protein n=1 Tax=Trichuris trichiura TaxID=36087 RepID=A0A077ZLR2_TRITR|nr:Bax1-I domain containing protein [Trichuris trichiura]
MAQIDLMQGFVNTSNQKIEKPVHAHLRRVYGSLSASMVAAAVGAFVRVPANIWKGTLWSLLLSIALLLLINGTQHTRENEKLRFCYLMRFAGLSGLSTSPLLDYIISINPARRTKMLLRISEANV